MSRIDANGRTRAAAIGLVWCLGCGGGEPGWASPGGSGVFLPGTTADSTGLAAVEPDSSSTTTTGSDESASTASTGTVKLDAGAPDSGEPVIGCRGKIDFLFVISAQSTMADEQQRLIAAFPEFMKAIEAKLEGFDVHILVTNASVGWQMQDCSLCADPSDCDPLGEPPGCGAVLDKCDQLFGAGLTFPAATGASNRRCDLHGGNRYIVSGEPDLAGAFSCIATVGLEGIPTLPAESMLAALDPTLNQPAFCNGGFVRDDALLVVTLIHDTRDFFSDGFPSQWALKLNEIKHGNPDALMVLALSNDIDLPGHLCFPEEPQSEWPNELRRLTEKVAHGRFGSICMDDYGPFFADAVDEMIELCDNLIPQ